MTADQARKAQAKALIDQALKVLRGGSYVKQSKKIVSLASYDDLSREQLDQSVIALVVHSNLSGGSVGDMNLYKLIRTYLWNPAARSEINAVVGRCGL